MNVELLNAWAAGLFEGEGSFIFSEGKPKKVTITSTDLDVLERMRETYGGIIIEEKRRKEHWKQAYYWYLTKESSYSFILLILPYLGQRRRQRAEEWLRLYRELEGAKENVNERYRQVLEMAGEKTHQQIADAVGLERSTVTKYLNKTRRG